MQGIKENKAIANSAVQRVEKLGGQLPWIKDALQRIELRQMQDRPTP